MLFQNVSDENKVLNHLLNNLRIITWGILNKYFFKMHSILEENPCYDVYVPLLMPSETKYPGILVKIVFTLNILRNTLVI